MRRDAPGLVLWLLSRLVPGHQREPLVGDLLEEFALRAKASSLPAARRWILRQAFASVPPLLWAALTRTAWLSTLGVALLAYIAVGVAEFLVNWALSGAPSGGAAYRPLGLLVTFPAVVFIAYLAARFRRGAPLVLGAAMLLAVTLITLTSTESAPAWYRAAYFVVGPAAVFIGSALRSWRRARP